MKLIEHILDLIEMIVGFILITFLILVCTSFLWLPWVLLFFK